MYLRSSKELAQEESKQDTKRNTCLSFATYDKMWVEIDELKEMFS